MQRLPLFLSLLVGLVASTAIAQDDTVSPRPPTATVPAISGQRAPRVVGTTYAPIRNSQGQIEYRPMGQNPNSVNSLIKRYKAAESDDDKDEIVDEMREQLNDSYDQSLASYEKNLDQMEARLKKLRAQLDKRRAAKDKIVDLRLEVIINEAEGLGWPDKRPAGFFEMGVPLFQGQNLFPGNQSPGWSTTEAVDSAPTLTRPKRPSRRSRSK